MNRFSLFSSPWWVNFLILVPVILFFWWRKNRLSLTKSELLKTAVFAFSLGLIESSVVIYLRAVLGFLPGYKGTIFDIWREASSFYNQQVVISNLPQSLVVIEVIREFSTMIILAAISWIVAKKLKEGIAVFLWTFAIWDITYYVYLWLTVRWPTSLTTPDVLFLIPQPWFGQVWYPLLVSSLSVLVVFVSSKD